jgi:DNA modification methylase
VDVFREVRRVLRDDGTCWINIGDSYASGKGTCFNPGGNTSSLNVHLKEQNVHPLDRGNKSTLAREGLKPKDLIGVPWMLAFALRDDGWYLRQDIIWHKPNPMPESVKDRCTKAHEYVFMLSKSARYWCDMDAVSEPATYAGKIVTLGEKSLSKGQANGANVAASGSGRASEVTVKDTRNLRSVWTLATLPTPEAHFATFPIELPETCLRAGCPEGGTVLDPFAGAGTTWLACLKNGRRFVGIELNAKYVELAQGRAHKYQPLFCEATL